MIYYYTRKKEYDMGQYALNTPPKGGICGGGMNSKAYNFLKAVNGEIIDSLIDKTGIALIDPLALTQLNKAEEQNRFDDYDKSEMVKILWAEEQEIIRWDDNQRRSIVSASDGVYTCNEYMQGILKEYEIDAGILYTPIDHNLYKPALEKKPKLVVMSQASYAKGTDLIIEMFKLLPETIDKVFIGNASLWGVSSRKADEELEKELPKVCTHIPAATHDEVAKQLSEAWGYASMSRYDVGSLAFLEAGFSGCWVFAHDYHRLYDEYQCLDRPKKSPKGMAETITKAFEEFSPNAINTQLRSELAKKHSYTAFRRSLKKIVSDIVIQDSTVMEGE